MAKASKPLKKISAAQGKKLCEDFLFSGLGRESILQEITKNYKIGVSSIDKWIKQAKPAAEARQKEAEAVRIRELDAANVEALKAGLKSDLEIEAVVSQIATGSLLVEEIIDGGAVIRNLTPNEITNAAKAIWAKRGSNAPTKVAQTNGAGEDVALTNLSTEDLKLLLALKQKATSF
jgi:ribosomal protein S8E